MLDPAIAATAAVAIAYLTNRMYIRASIYQLSVVSRQSAAAVMAVGHRRRRLRTDDCEPVIELAIANCRLRTAFRQLLTAAHPQCASVYPFSCARFVATMPAET